MRTAFLRPVHPPSPPKIRRDEIKVPAPKEIEQEAQQSALKKYGWPVVMVVMIVVIVGLMIRRGGGLNPMYLIFPIMMMVSMAGMMSGGIGGAIKSRAQIAADRKSISRGLSRAREEVFAHGSSMHTALQNAYPDPKIIEGVIGTTRMWQVQPTSTDFDFSALRYGLGEVELATQMPSPEAPEGEFLEPVGWVKVVRFMKHQSTVPGIPVALTTSKFPAIGFTAKTDEAKPGDMSAKQALAAEQNKARATEVSMGMLRSMLIQAAVTHGPDNMPIVLLTDDVDARRWSWLKWLPHTRHPYEMDQLGAVRMMYNNWSDLVSSLGGDEESGRGAVIAFDSTHDKDREFTTEKDRHTLVIVDSTIRDKVLDSTIAPLAGVTWLIVDPPNGALTDQEGLVLSCDAAGNVWRSEAERSEAPPVKVAVADHLSERDARRIARAVARFEVAAIDLTGSSAPRVERGKDWSTLMRVRDPGSLDLMSSWNQITKWDDKRRLRVPIGFKHNGERYELDLKDISEGGTGPHGMVIGFTGSGKSEFLRNLILNLMITHSPDMVNFFLTDFKGGATFLGLENEPHTSAVITNMEEEEHLVARMKEALFGELDRRERIFREAQAKYPKEDIKNLSDYLRLRAKVGDDHLPALPALVVIIDEFAELLEQHPEYGKIFIRIGRKGRSVGVHLIYASQTLEGTGKTHGLESNVSYRIGLKTVSAADSRALLGTDAAYKLPGSPGHAIVQGVALAEMVQIYSGYTGALYFPAPPEPDQHHADDSELDAAELAAREQEAKKAAPLPFTAAVRPLSDTGTQIAVNEPERTEEEINNALTVWTVCIDQLKAVTDEEPYRLYHPPLSVLTLDQVDPRYRDWTPPTNDKVADLVLPMGRFDDPIKHAQPPWMLDAAGNTLIVGGAKKGKSTAMDTIIGGLALAGTPQQVQIYAVSYTGGLSDQLHELPHVGGWASSADEDAIERMLAEMKKIRRDRERLFREHKIIDMAHYRQLRAEPDSKFRELDNYGDVFFFIDGWDAAVSDSAILANRAEEVAGPFQGGTKYGLYLIVSTARHNQIRPIQSLITTTIEMASDTDLSLISHTLMKNLPPEPGNVVVSGSELYALVALPRIDNDADTSTLPGGIQHLVSKVLAASSGEAERLKTLPTSVLREDLFSAAQISPAAPIRERLRLPIGLRESTGAPAYAEMSREPHLLILGESKSGMSEAIGTFIASVASRFPTKEDALVLLYDTKSSSLERIPENNLYAVVTNDEDFKTRLQALINEQQTSKRTVPEGATLAQRQARSWWDGPELFIVVDNWELVAPRHATTAVPVLELIHWVRKEGYERGIHIVIAMNTAEIGVRTLSDPVIKQLNDSRAPVLMLSTDKLQGSYVGVKFATFANPGRARYVEHGVGRNERIQLAWSGLTRDDSWD
ncbi:type VII secretion protein EccCa [Mycobacteroides abscessus]